MQMRADHRLSLVLPRFQHRHGFRIIGHRMIDDIAGHQIIAGENILRPLLGGD
ncbi:hypothetical protein JCM17846_25460 [Iodidimonas nitroreducens]|uniref:Uncharacterized protein n=1 Tax=Iodidimonas nitroreducens TaxID=1236968 RepID=A0A5A7NAV8_9PROT|nr:hypothetical protein JCM17846_25460 [Iodidimonas nitroreducens]